MLNQLRLLEGELYQFSQTGLLNIIRKYVISEQLHFPKQGYNIKCFRDIVNKVNGILVPGGGCAFNISFGISQSTSEIFHIAKRVINV